MALKWPIVALAAGNTSVFADLCRSDTPCVQSAAFVIKSDYLPSVTLIRILVVAAYIVRLFLHNWLVIQSYLCD